MKYPEILDDVRSSAIRIDTLILHMEKTNDP